MASLEGVPQNVQNINAFLKSSGAGHLRRKGYWLGKTVGEGSYCKVKTALKFFANGQAKRLACKIISKHKASEEFVSKFLPRELSILQRVRHPNIIQMLDFYESVDHVYIFTNYCDRGDLLEYVRKAGSLKDRKAKHFFRQLVSAVNYLHSQHVAHRDLKCENIFITGTDIIVIGDFGFARYCTEYKTQKRCLSDTFCGSAAYAAPEILKGEPYNPKMYDVWSLGCVLYIMLTGSMPFDDTNIHEMLMKQLRKQFDTHSYPISNNAEHLIFHMLEPDVVLRATISQVYKSSWLSNNAYWTPSSPTETCSITSHSQIQPIINQNKE